MNLQEALKEVKNGNIVERNTGGDHTLYMYQIEMKSLNLTSIRCCTIYNDQGENFEIKKYLKEAFIKDHNCNLNLNQEDIEAVDWEIFE